MQLIAFRCPGMIPARVGAVVVHHVVVLDPLHGCVLLRAEPRAHRRRLRLPAARRGESRAPSDDEPGEPGDEGLVPVVHPVLAPVRGPGGGIPYGAIHPHRPHREYVCTLSWIPPYRYVVHKESARSKLRSVFSKMQACY